MSGLTPLRAAILRAGLPTTDDPPDVVLSGTDWCDTDSFADLVQWAVQERLDGLAWATLTSDDSPWPIDDEQRSELLDAHIDGLRAGLAAEATAVWALEVLETVAVPAWLLKGLASAHLDYPDPSLRTSFDADLLVARRDLPRAIDALLAAGCRRASPPLRVWWEQRFARAVELISPDGVEVDLHAAIVDGSDGVSLDHGRLCHHRALDEPGVITLAGNDCRVLSAPGRLLAACYAIVLSRGPNLRLARDIAQLVLVTEVDIGAARRLAGHRSALIDEGLERAATELGLILDAGSTAQGPSVRNGDGTGGARSSQRHQSTAWSTDALSAWQTLTLGQRPAYALGIIWPSRAHLAWRRLSRMSHLRRLAATVLTTSAAMDTYRT